MAWSILTFGKHRGKTLPQVVFIDPDWFFWAIEQNAFVNKGSLASEAREIDHKARHIKVPQKKGKEKLIVEYVIHPPTGKFGGMELVPMSRPPHEGSSPTSRSENIDLSTPRTIAPYDKLGCKIMIGSMKYYLFANKNAHMTKAKSEGFFENSENFALPHT